MSLKPNAPMTVLIVDDDPNILELLEESLQDLSFKVVQAGDGEEGLAQVKKNKIDCIITDISMPKLDGPAMIKRLHADGHTIPFFFVTAYHDYPRENLNEFKPRAIIFKPFDFEELALLVKNHMMRI
jgi:DNA-binding response OmpR family regulator